MHKKHGFGLVGILLIVVVIGVVGFAGWYVVISKNSKQNNSIEVVSKSNNAEPAIEANTSTENSNNTESISETNDNFKNSNIKQEYLDIVEWGVRIPLSSEIRGAYYKVNDSFEQSASNPTSLTIYSEETDGLIGSGGVSCKDEYIAFLIRFPSNDSYWQSDDTDADLFRPTIDIDGFSFGASTIKQYGPPCFAKNPNSDKYETDHATEEKFDVLVSIFMSDFRKLSSIDQ